MPGFRFLPEVAARAAALAVSAWALLAAAPAHAAAVSGQGTWETTLQGRDLDGNAANGFEAYYDTALNITWLADANYAYTSSYSIGRMDWFTAKDWAANLNVNGITGWRLPDVKPINGSSFNYSYSSAGTTDVGFNIISPQSEMAHLFHVTLGNKSFFDMAGNVQSDSGLSNTGPFENVQFYDYWSGVVYATNSPVVWYFDTLVGAQDGTWRRNSLSAWAVRSGDVAAVPVAAVPEPQTYVLVLASLAVVAVARRRQR